MDYEMLKEFYTKMYKIRLFETTLLELFSENKLSGTTHTCIGQEAIAVSLMAHIKEKDIVFSNHRCHGHFIAYSDNVQILLAEIMGKKSGVCRGRGGSQHLCYKRFFSNGVQGGIVPNAVGMAWAEKIKKTKNIAVVFIGDGTLGEGVVYESFNMASIYNIPVLFVVENNGYAMSTRKEDALAGSIAGRMNAFDIRCAEMDDGDIEKLYGCFAEAVSYVRETGEPFCQIVNTYRLAAHSKGDDFRDPEEIKTHWDKDLLKKLESCLPEGESESIRKRVNEELKKAILFCTHDEEPEKDGQERAAGDNGICEESLLNLSDIRHVKQLNKALERAIQSDPAVILLGEDIRDPYGGAFKVTRGLSDQFPAQVINTPISEAGFIGIGVGLAMNGMKPVVEIMFGDFISLGFDQLLNHAAKYNWMYDGQVDVPLLIRVPSGGGRGYGPTHSQSLEKFFVGIPGLNIIALSPIVDTCKLLERVESTIHKPTLLVENKKMYGGKQLIAADGRIESFSVMETRHQFPMYKLSLDEEEKADAVIITYGGMLPLAMQAAEQLLIEDEILVNIICLTLISPIDYCQLADCVGDEKVIFTLEEGTKRAGWGAEVVSGLCERMHKRKFYRLGAKDCVISCSRKEEEEILPDITYILHKIKGKV